MSSASPRVLAWNASERARSVKRWGCRSRLLHRNHECSNNRSSRVWSLWRKLFAAGTSLRSEQNFEIKIPPLGIWYELPSERFTGEQEYRGLEAGFKSGDCSSWMNLVQPNSLIERKGMKSSSWGHLIDIWMELKRKTSTRWRDLNVRITSGWSSDEQDVGGLQQRNCCGASHEVDEGEETKWSILNGTLSIPDCGCKFGESSRQLVLQ